jgi:hypothetical protein
MQPTKLITLLQTFNKEEIKRFGDYVQSPYFNKREAPIRLYKALAALHPNFEALKWNKLFKKAFPEKTDYNDTYLRNVLSDLLELAEGFLGQEYIKDQPLLQGYVVGSLIAKHQYRYAESNLKKMKALLSPQKLFYPTIHAMVCFYNLLKMRLCDRQEQRQAYSETQQEFADALKAQCINDLLTRYHEMCNDADVYYNYPYQFDFFDRFIAIIQPHDLEKDPHLALKYYQLQLQLQKSWEAWHNLYHFVQQHKDSLAAGMIFGSKQSLSNFLIQQQRKETYPSEYTTQKLFELYEDMIALRHKENIIPAITGTLFENIVANGVALKGVDWAKQYIETNSQHLPANIREGLTAYCWARLYFHKGEYVETIAILANIEPFYYHYYFNVKSLMLQTYYEMNNYEAFTSTLDTFKHTLANHRELAEKHRVAYTNMNTILLKLYRLRLKYDPKTAQALKQSLDNCDLSIFSKHWAVQKLDALIYQNGDSAT